MRSAILCVAMGFRSNRFTVGDRFQCRMLGEDNFFLTVLFNKTEVTIYTKD
jgi:hypothetical protein